MIIDGNEEFIRDNIVTFDHHEVARRLRLRLGQITVAEVVVNTIEIVSPDKNAFLPTPEMKMESARPAQIAAAVMSGRILKHDNPKYPGIARAAHIQGIVILQAVIGEDGHMSDLSVISSPDSSLTESSLKAVRKWTYEPYLLDGKPIKVDTTISVNFAMPSR